jgi:hypothetical protein
MGNHEITWAAVGIQGNKYYKPVNPQLFLLTIVQLIVAKHWTKTRTENNFVLLMFLFSVF